MSAVDVHGLPAKWRAEADELERLHGKQTGFERNFEDYEKAGVLSRAADELEAALRQSGEAVPQYRHKGSCDWYDGVLPADCFHDEFETRTLYTASPATSGLVEAPTPRNRVEAAALAKVALAYLGVIDAHIDAAIARCETDSALAAHDAGGGR